MENNSEEKATEIIKIEINKGTRIGVYVAYLRIKHVADRENFVPSQLIHEFLNHIKMPPKMDMKQVRQMIDKFTEDTVAYFKKQRDARYFNTSFEKMVYDIYGHIYAEHIERNEKRKALQFIYKLVSDRSDKMLSSKSRYTHYKKCVIAGYIASQYGFTPTQAEHDDDAYNELLYDRLKRSRK